MRFTFWRKARLLVLVLVIACFFIFSTSYFDDSVLSYVSTSSQSLFEELVNDTLSDELVESINGGFISVEKDSMGKISYAYVDAYKANYIRTEASKKLQELAKNMNMQDKITKMEIPFGYFFTSIYFLSNGLTIPVKLKIYQAKRVFIETTMTPYGINSTMFEISLSIVLDTYIQIPFQAKRQELSFNTPLSIEIINGEIPNFYAYSN